MNVINSIAAACGRTAELIKTWTQEQLASHAVQSVNGKTGVVLLAPSDVGAASKTEFEEVETDIAALEAYTNTKMSMKLLWTNASPNSNFTEQSISINLTGMIGVYISFFGNRDSGITSDTLATGGNIDIFPGGNMLMSSNAGVLYGRAYKKLDDTHISFEHAYNTNNWAVTDNWIIPFQIYGIKGVIE